MQARTLGTPSTFIKQLGHLPDMHSKPRGRWYLKLRVKIRCPERYSAEAMVSDRNAGHAVHVHQAVGTFAGHAQQASRPVVFETARENTLPGTIQCGSYGVRSERWARRPRSSSSWDICRTCTASLAAGGI